MHKANDKRIMSKTHENAISVSKLNGNWNDKDGENSFVVVCVESNERRTKAKKKKLTVYYKYYIFQVSNDLNVASEWMNESFSFG